MNNIILTGMPGAGKSTLGVLLAKSLGYSFMDTDLVIQQRMGMLLNEIIKSRGIEGFLQIEEEVLIKAAESESYIIATGGSAVLSDSAMRALKQSGRVIYIKVELPELERRLSDIKARGVVIGENESLADIYKEREPLYEKYADLTVSPKGNSIEESLYKIVKEIK